MAPCVADLRYNLWLRFLNTSPEHKRPIDGAVCLFLYGTTLQSPVFPLQFLFTQPPPPFSFEGTEGDVGLVERPFRFDDDLIPFSDTPQISRFGPISRKILCPQSIPTQSQAVIEDETKPTSVVRHAKHMSRPVPVAASLFHQNGNLN